MWRRKNLSGEECKDSHSSKDDICVSKLQGNRLVDQPERTITVSSAHDNDALIHGPLTVYRQAYKVFSQ